MAEPAVVQEPVKSAALWEDFVDIFYAPSSVFKRRQNDSPWPMILILTVLLLIISFATYNAMSGAMETEVRRQLAKNPQMTQDLIDRSLKFSSWTTRLGAVFYPIAIMVAAFFAWAVGKLVGSKQTYQVAMVMVTYASIVDVVSKIVAGAQAMLMDSANLTSIYMLSTGPARFVDPTTASPVMLTIFTRLDLFTIWYTVLLGIGMYATGKVSKGSAAAFAVMYWLVVTAFSLLAALSASMRAG